MNSPSQKIGRLVCLLSVSCLALTTCASDPVPGGTRGGETGGKVLLLTKSSGYIHDVVKEPDGQTSLVERTLATICAELGHTLTATKDASLINSAYLENFDVVVFYTCGNLTTSGRDEQTPMGPGGVKDLTQWIEDGGGFVGFHSACDTLEPESPETTSPYLEMLGGDFKVHGGQFVGELVSHDSSHPTMAHFPSPYSLHEEWYVFENFAADEVHVLTILDPGNEGENQEMYDLEPYPYSWCKALGEGRIYFTGLAHNAATWDDPTFQRIIPDVIQWASGIGEAQAEPNYSP